VGDRPFQKTGISRQAANRLRRNRLVRRLLDEAFTHPYEKNTQKNTKKKHQEIIA